MDTEDVNGSWHRTITISDLIRRPFISLSSGQPSPDKDSALPWFASASTSRLPVESAYDIWRETVLSFYDPDPLPKGQAFAAEGHMIVWQQADFCVYSSSAIAGNRTSRQMERDGIGDVSIGLVLSGSRGHDLDEAGQYRTKAGEFYAYDAKRPSRIVWGDHEAVYLNLRQADLRACLGGDIPSALDIARYLETCSLAPFLRSQYQLLAHNVTKLSPADRALLLGQARALTLSALRGLGRKNHKAAPPQQEVLLAMALRYMEAHLFEPGLNADQVAFAIGCSRATLYRLFAEHEHSVSQSITSARLTRARDMLRSDPGASNEQVAYLCGFTDVRTFYRAFRRHFGTSPAEARRSTKE